MKKVAKSLFHKNLFKLEYKAFENILFYNDIFTEKFQPLISAFLCSEF